MNAPTRHFDAVAMEIFSNRLLAITEEMGATLIRSSFSTNIKERKDCSVAIFDARGRLVVQATHIPVHLGSLSGAVDAVLRNYGPDGIRPGDVYMSNDAYLAGGSHAPDINVITPVFIDGALRFFAANVGHHSDVGGALPGSTAPHFRSVWEEGIRIPTMRIVSEGRLETELLEMLAENTREPAHRKHDLRAQVATNERGARLLRELAAESSLAGVLASIDDILAYTERRLRSAIGRLPDGSATFTEWMDDDGMGGDPVPITATVTIRGDDIHVDFAGTGKQSRGAFNLPEYSLRASVYYAVKTMLDPELPPNNGMFGPISLDAPRGTIVNPIFPAAVGARATTAQRVAGTVIGALVQLVPGERAMASANDVMPSMVFAGPGWRPGEYFVYLETIGGGAGGRVGGDGMDGTQVHTTNTSNLPTEALEIEYPLLVEEYGLVPDSGGAGRHRGGMGIARQIRSLVDGIVCGARCDGAVHGPAGLAGGLPGRTARAVWNPGRDGEKPLPAKTSGLNLDAGQSIRLETPGGGGFGAPVERSVEDLAADLRGGKVTEAAARADYGDALVDRALAA
jgi:N-methylhydantoinase B